MSRQSELSELARVFSESSLSNRNLIINGAMQVAQRGTSVNSINGTVVYCADRMVCFTRGSGAATFSQDTDVPSGQGFGNSLKVDVTTVDTSLAGNDLYLVDQRLEGQNLQQLAKGSSGAKSVTVSFWVKSPKTGTHIVELFDDANTRQVSQAYTIAAANTWEYKTLTFDGDTSGALPNDNSKAFTVRWFLAAGTDYTSGTLNTSWAANTVANRAVGQVNVFDNTSNNFYLTGVQLEVGDTATPFEHRSYGQELALCQRYYYRIDSPIGGNVNDGAFGTSAQYNSTLNFASVRFPVSVRAATTLSYSSSSDFQLVGGSTGTVPTAFAINANTRTTAELMITTSSFGTSGQANWIRLQSGGWIAFDAEL